MRVRAAWPCQSEPRPPPPRAPRRAQSPAQVLGSWCVQKGLIYIPKSVKAARMLENADVFSFEASLHSPAHAPAQIPPLAWQPAARGG